MNSTRGKAGGSPMRVDEMIKPERMEETPAATSAALQHLLSASPTVIYVLKVIGDGFTPVWVSENITRIFGYDVQEALAPNWWVDHLHPEDRKAALSRQSAVLTDSHLTHEYRFLHKDGSYRWVRDQLRRLREEESNALEIVGAWMDITERKEMEAAVRESGEGYRRVVESARDVIYTLSVDGVITSLNPAFEATTGWSRAEWLGKHFEPLIHPDDIPAAAQVLQQQLESGGESAPPARELRIRTKSGTYVVGEFISTALARDGTVTGFLGVARDITQRKRAEMERAGLLRELERLTQRLIHAHEEERGRVARDIHDGPTQQVATADMYMQMYLSERTHREDPQIEGHLEIAKSHLTAAIKEIRRIISDLRPSVLEESGLVEALRRHLEEVGDRTDMQVEFKSDLGGLCLDPTAEAALFRIAQEAVGNALKHSGTEKISVSLQKAPTGAALEIRDWGAGFDVGKVMNSSGGGDHVGLVGMRERAELVGGRLQLNSMAGHGTKVRVEIPLRRRTDPYFGRGGRKG